MLTKEQILTTLRQNKPFLQKEMGVKKIGLFGSYAQGKQTIESDVDVFVEFEKDDYKKIIQVLVFLEKQLPAKIDLVYKHSQLRPSFLQTLEDETIYA
jgi:predicted nucleotidyltransferase